MRSSIISIIIVIFSIYTKNSFSQGVPDVLYYRFNNNSSSYTQNYAVTGSENLKAALNSQLVGSGGQFDSCLIKEVTKMVL